MDMEVLVRLAGIAQLALCVASVFLPRALHFRDGLRSAPPLMRHMFWTYAGYIFAINLAIGLLSTLSPRLLLDGSMLAALVASFIAVYWGARMIIQFISFGLDAAETGAPYYRFADAGLKLLFTGLTVVYCLAAWCDWTRKIL